MSAKRATLASVEPHIHRAVEDKPVKGREGLTFSYHTILQNEPKAK